MKTLILAAIRCSLMFTAVVGFSLACPANANLITNGGFETGDFTGWTVVGDASVDCCPHSGAFAAHLDDGPVSLTQNVATTPGAYVVDFWLKENFALGPFFVSWGGSEIFSDFFIGGEVSPYTEHRFTVTASSATTELEFLELFLGSGIFLDDISVNPVGVPDGGSTVSLLGFALLGLAALRRKLSC